MSRQILLSGYLLALAEDGTLCSSGVRQAEPLMLGFMHFCSCSALRVPKIPACSALWVAGEPASTMAKIQVISVALILN
jgi:hypothetical protein